MRAQHIVVIGAGVGGLCAASAAAGAGARVTVVSNEQPGGRGIWHSLLPSKVLLTLADGLGQSKRFPDLGLRETAGVPDSAAASRRIAELSRSWSRLQSAELERLGVRFVHGRAAFADSHRLDVQNRGSGVPLEADAFIVATGSIPVFPPGLRPDGDRLIAPRFISKLERWPASVVVVGAGATGAEFVYCFNRLGAAVSWVVDEYGVLPAFDRDAVAVLVEALERRGVVRQEGVAARSAAADPAGVKVTLDDGRELSAAMAFIALGRQPDVADLHLERGGLEINAPRGLEVDEFCRSAVPHVYGAGDVTGKPFIANKAMAQGWIAGRHASGRPTPPFRLDTLVEAVYTDPEVAQIGMTKAAVNDVHGVRVRRLLNRMNLRATLAGQTDGFVEFVSNAETGVVLGASAAGAHAADVLAPLALGIRLKAQLDDMASSFAAHPGFAESLYAAAREV